MVVDVDAAVGCHAVNVDGNISVFHVTATANSEMNPGPVFI